LFFGLNQLIFPPNQVPCSLSLNLPHFGLRLLFRPLSKGLGTNSKLLTSKIAWIHWFLDLEPSSKVAISLSINRYYNEWFKSFEQIFNVLFKYKPERAILH
jgi:hypothetical protein